MEQIKEAIELIRKGTPGHRQKAIEILESIVDNGPSRDVVVSALVEEIDEEAKEDTKEVVSKGSITSIIGNIVTKGK